MWLWLAFQVLAYLPYVMVKFMGQLGEYLGVRLTVKLEEADCPGVWVDRIQSL